MKLSSLSKVRKIKVANLKNETTANTILLEEPGWRTCLLNQKVLSPDFKWVLSCSFLYLLYSVLLYNFFPLENTDKEQCHCNSIREVILPTNTVLALFLRLISLYPLPLDVIGFMVITKSPEQDWCWDSLKHQMGTGFWSDYNCLTERPRKAKPLIKKKKKRAGGIRVVAYETRSARGRIMTFTKLWLLQYFCGIS